MTFKLGELNKLLFLCRRRLLKTGMFSLNISKVKLANSFGESTELDRMFKVRMWYRLYPKERIPKIDF